MDDEKQSDSLAIGDDISLLGRALFVAKCEAAGASTDLA